MTNILLIIGAGIIGIILGYITYTWKIKNTKDQAYIKAKHAHEEAEEIKKKKIHEAKKEIENLENKFRQEEKKFREEMSHKEKKMIEKEETIEKKVEDIEQKKEMIEKKLEEIQKKDKELEQLKQKQEDEIESISKLSQEEAKTMLMEKVEKECSSEIYAHIKKIEDDMKESVQTKAKKLIAESMQRCASEVVAESSVTLVELPSDDMKGRIIGKEGRNIQAFERETGVDVIIDDTPETITLSGFDLVRRYVAKISMERLIKDGRIHPTHIEETVEKVKKEVEKQIKEIGEKITVELGVLDLHPELIKLLGKLKFRTSAGQNVLKHSVEVSYIAKHMAEELGADTATCVKGALLHDIGKAVEHDVEGNHVQVGKDIAEKYRLSESVVHIIEAHDGKIPCKSLEALIVLIANKLSILRPGAKRDGLEVYIKRLKDLEKTAESFEDVDHAYAIHGGKEVRIMVKSDIIDDLGAYKLAKEISGSIEKSMDYAGQIKVSIIRKTDVIEYAK